MHVDMRIRQVEYFPSAFNTCSRVYQGTIHIEKADQKGESSGQLAGERNVTLPVGSVLWLPSLEEVVWMIRIRYDSGCDCDVL